MPLTDPPLAQALAQRWLGRKAGDQPGSPQESGERFAAAFAEWFAPAMAGPNVCTTATARQPELASQAAAAFAVRSAVGAGSLLGAALGAYLTGQLFGVIAANVPLGIGLASASLQAVFSSRSASSQIQADQIARVCLVLVHSTTVPLPNGPTPVL